MSIGKLVGSALLIIAAIGVIYTIEGALTTVWGVALFPDTPLIIKLFIPTLAIGFGSILIAMLVNRLRRTRHTLHSPTVTTK